MIKNIYFIHLLNQRKGLLRTEKLIWLLNGIFSLSKTFHQSTWDCNREFNLQENVSWLDVRIQFNSMFTSSKTFNSIFNSSKSLFHWRESATESLSLQENVSWLQMWEFITESGMIKNIYFTQLLKWRKNY